MEGEQLNLFSCLDPDPTTWLMGGHDMETGGCAIIFLFLSLVVEKGSPCCGDLLKWTLTIDR